MLFEHSPIPVVLSLLADGRIVALNDAATASLGVERARAVGARSVEIGLVTPEEHAQVREVFQRDGRVRDLEVRRRTATGAPRVLQLSVEPLDLDGEPHSSR